MHACNKTSYTDGVLENPLYEERIKSLIRKCHDLGSHATHCLKRFVIRSQPVPVLTLHHVEAILYLLNKGRDWNPQNPEKIAIRRLLLDHVEEYRQLLGLELIALPHDQQSINFLAKSIFTNIEVNIKEHYMQMFLRYINLRLGKSHNSL